MKIKSDRFHYMQKKFLVIAVLLIAMGAVSAQDNVYRVNFGKGNRIEYLLSNGTYSITWKGKQLIKDVAFQCSGEKAIDSRMMGIASIQDEPFNSPAGKGRVYKVSFANDKSVEQLFYVFKNADYFITRLKWNTQQGVSQMSPFVSEYVQLDEAGDNRVLYVPFDNDMWARFNAAKIEKAQFSGSEVTSIYNVESNRGMVIGSLEQDNWKSGISIKGKTGKELSMLSVVAGFSDSIVTHDRIPHGKILPVDGTVYSPQVMIGFFDDWRNGMETFAELNGKLQPRVIFKWNQSTPMGWNSWGMLREKITFDQAMKVVDFFADSLIDFRTAENSLFIDLDAFWDNMTPGGIDGDVSKLEQFVANCKSKGLKPGIYWTPFTDWGKSDKKIEGAEEYTYKQVWTTQHGRMLDIDGGRAMDPTHPATLRRVVHTISKMKALGFEMIKIDFLGHAAQEADKFYDPAVTTGMQAFRKGMTFLDSVLGNQMLVYAAISPNLATARYVHVRRIACDAFSSMENTEYTMSSTGYGWWESTIYNYVDADHVVFANENDGVNRARLAAALTTGTLITGDDFSSYGKWSATARKLLQDPELLAIIKDGNSFRPVIGNTGDRGVELLSKKSGKDIYLCWFNYSDHPRTIQVPPALIQPKAKKRWKMKELFSKRSSKGKGPLQLNLPAQDAAIFRIRAN